MPSASGLIKNGVALAVGFLVVALLVANLIPQAINETVGVGTGSWGSTETTLWDLLPMAYVLGPFLFFIFAALAYARS